MSKSYSTITETPGIGATREQLSMLYTRYKWAADASHQKDVLEVACGAGQGLGYIARSAKRVIGGDIDENNLQSATTYYQGRKNIEIHKLDAHQLPFPDKSFDTIILYEAIYYLQEPEKFFRECKRLLRNSGRLLLSTVNKEWSDFNPSPFSTRYFSARELSNLLQSHQFQVSLFGAFPTQRNTAKARLISLIKRTAVSLRLVPKTMRGKQLLKRIFLGKLAPLPKEVEDHMASLAPLEPIDSNAPTPYYKIIYASAQLV